MDNPFRGLTEEQHCIKAYARVDGREVSPRNPAAKQFCAIGAMLNQGISERIQDEFRDWLKGQEGVGVEGLNDRMLWTFAQFADAWDRWQSEVSHG